LAKRAFQLHGTDNHGRAVVSRRVSGGKLVETIVQLAPEVVAMKTSCGATVGGRRFPELGIEVRLIHAKFIRPGVKSAKNYALDAAAICEAVQRPHMRFVPIKSIEQQDIQALHRAREQVMRWRTALINHIRGLLLQYGVAVPQGPARFRQEVTLTLDDPSTEPPPLAFELFRRLMSQLRALEDWLTILDRRIVALCRYNELYRRLAALPGVGPIIATALVGSVGDARQFRCDRDLSA
jgi:transposase